MRNDAVQKPLPKLPVPELVETLDKYLLCIKPIVSSDQYERTRQIVDEFRKPGGTGELLQKRLLEYAETTDNWVLSLMLHFLDLKVLTAFILKIRKKLFNSGTVMIPNL